MVGLTEPMTLGALEKSGMIRLFRGQVISKKAIAALPGSYPIYSSSVKNNGLFGRYGRYMFEEELITWSVDGGGHFFYRPRHKFSVTNVCGYLRVLSSQIDTQYLAYQLQALHSRLQFDYTLKAHPSVIRGAYTLSLPAIEEQRAVAAALRDADNLIDGLERMIAKKQAIKQGMMQQVLTGRTRLPGFANPWNYVRLGEIARIKTGSRNNQDKEPSGQYPFFVRSATVERINSYSYDCEAILVPGEGGIGSIFHYVNGKFEVHQRVYKISDFAERVSGRFIYHYMRQFFGAHAMENSVKATVDSLRLPTFSGFELRLPAELDEQEAIVGVLADAECEIELLQRRLTKARSTKTGVMQELLTGRTRLPVMEGVA